MQSSKHHPEPAFHALFVSDILHLICDLLEVSDWMSLTLTCKSMFATAASHIWANLDGVQVLTDLLVEAAETEQNTTIISEAAVDFTRFDVYAPLVRHLRVYGRTSRYLRGEYRRRCALRSQQSALFPRLESITMHTSDLYHDSDALMWIEILAAPTLAELRVIPIKKRGATAFVSHLATSNISRLLLDICPRIKRLEFYPSNIVKNGENLDPSDALWQAPLRQSFESLVNLREATGSIGLIDCGGLAILGALPCLQKLSIDGCKECPRDLQLSIPDKSFPTLAHLSLIRVHDDSLVALMGVRPLVRRLISVSLSQWFDSWGNYHHGGLQRQRWLRQSLPQFLEHTDSLKSFSYDAGESSPNDQRDHYSIGDNVLPQAISKLKLESLSLSGLSFNLAFTRDISSVCSSLVELRMPETFVQNRHLHWFARLPKLKHLCLLLSFSHVPPPSAWHSANAPLEIMENTEVYIDAASPVGVEEAARFLLYLWPNLRRVEWVFRKRLYGNGLAQGPALAKRYCQFIDSLNDTIPDIRLKQAEAGSLG